jgi:hypothetical protein
MTRKILTFCGVLGLALALVYLARCATTVFAPEGAGT